MLIPTFSRVANTGMDWAYFQLNPLLDQRVIDAGEGRYELLVVVSSLTQVLKDLRIKVLLVFVQVRPGNASSYLKHKIRWERCVCDE